MVSQNLHRLVKRFLAWPLPRDFAPDCGISFKWEWKPDAARHIQSWPTGTNLFTADQARVMLEYVLATETELVEQDHGRGSNPMPTQEEVVQWARDNPCMIERGEQEPVARNNSAHGLHWIKNLSGVPCDLFLRPTTLQELRELAEKLGYSIVPRIPFTGKSGEGEWNIEFRYLTMLAEQTANLSPEDIEQVLLAAAQTEEKTE